MAAGSNNIVTDGLVGCWDAGNRRSYPGTGTTWTDLVLQNAGSMSPSPTFQSDKAGVMSFDGTDDVVTISSSTELSALTTGDFSFEAWVNVVDADSNPNKYVGVIVLVDVGLVLMGHTYPAGEAGVGILWPVTGNNWAGEVTSATIKYGEWAYIGCTRTGTTYNTYINGVNYTTSTDNGNWAMTDWKIGKGYSSHFFYGDMGVIRVYNRVLTDAEVKQNYEATKPRFKPRITKSGMFANWDAGDPESYNGGQTWTDTANGFVGPFYNGAGEAISFDSANGGSLVFDGTDDRIGPIILPGDYSGTARSILLWVSPDTHEQEMIAFNSADDKFKATVGQSTSYGTYIFRADVGESSPQTGSFADSLITVGDWACIGMTINASDEIVSMYLNGVSKTGGSRGWNFQDDTYIGRSSSGAPWNGKIATVRLYTKTLSAVEILDNYNKTKGRFGH